MAGALGVVITTDVPMGGQHAQPVYVDDGLPIVGPAQAIVVTNGEIPQAGGPPLAVRLAPAGTPTTGPVMPVYVVSGSLGSNAAPVSTLLNGLTSYWKQDEASGVGIDSVGTNTLTDNNTATSAAGKVGTARQFTAANSEYFSCVSNAGLQVGAIDFEWSCWVQIASKTVTRHIFGKSPLLSDIEYQLLYDQVTDRYVFRYYSGGYRTVTASLFGSPLVNTWTYIDAWYTASDKKLHVQVNGGTENASATQPVHPPTLTGDLNIGRRSDDGLSYWDGLIDDVKFWKRVLTVAERAEDYANGLAGIPLL